MKKQNLNELLFVLYIFLFAFIKLFFKINPSHTFLMLLFPTVLILIISLLYNGKNAIIIKPQIIFVTLFVLITFILSIIFNNNSYLYLYLYEFLIYGLIPMYLFSKVTDYNMVINIGGKLSIIVFILYCSDPLNNYYYFSDYMGFGFGCMLPVFFFSCLSRKLLKKNKYIFLELLSLAELLIFCNRGSFLTAILIEMMFFIVDNDKGFNKVAFFKVTVLLTFFFLLISKINYFLVAIQILTKRMHFDSYSISAISSMITGNSTGLSGRDVIWKNALLYFSKSPFIGHGIGSFEKVYNIYTHNIILETLTSMGLIGVIILIVSIMKYFFKVINDNNKCFYIGLLIMAIVPLMFSIYIYKWIYFWLFIYIAYAKSRNKKVGK